MSNVIPIRRSRFAVGDVIHHRLFDYRGVVVDVDLQCQAPDEWYDNVARSRPPKDRPWYHVLVHDSARTTYVAERNLEADGSGAPVSHPLLPQFFSSFEHGRYVGSRRAN
ncbi:MAG: heat shock protein HspQ [Halioglobus sp.]|nr:heat shock protein HspQ [Halioglobus sp.]